MNTKTLLLVAALTLGGAATANAATTAASPTKPAIAKIAKKAPSRHAVAKPKASKHS
jgi:hypothetical protein